MSKFGVLKLRGVVQHYDWGGLDFIPTLLGSANAERKPCAELWIGAHPKAPSIVELAEREVPLNQFIAEAPQNILGPSASDRFGGTLPYLFKVLDVARMLSIQVHPTREQARNGFARENAAGIAPQAAERNYKDENHKPEVAVALTEFWMLHGFRPLEQIAETLNAVPELRTIMPDFAQRLALAGDAAGARGELLRDFYRTVMTMPQERADTLLDQLVTRLAAAGPTDKNDPDYWVVRAAATFPPVEGHRDRGIFTIYLLNLVRLRPGQGTFQPAGVLHAYLEGVNVELMANSDNVLRGGLTPKHVDVPELLRILSFDSGVPQVLEGELSGSGERVYRTTSDEFEVSRIDLAPGQEHRARAAHGPDSIVVLEGSAILISSGQNIPLVRGSIVFVPFGTEYVLHATDAFATLFKATVPGRSAVISS